ncbi:hypothetical protein [Butyrivibrio sp. VCB2006]|uniref:hypothetical protein n=1 Tax=Butyrivibrio sp. VCB2006 TaxID=1280679 RepID=UPI0004925E0E|nr:hypothetical protein [Butyrivibrio sp. VCB2006]
MESKKTTLALIIYIVIAIVVILGLYKQIGGVPGITKKEKPVIPLDEPIVVGEYETTIRKLFEAADEDYACAKYVKVEADYSYSNRDSSESNSGTRKYWDNKESKDGIIIFERYYKDVDNIIEVYSGDFEKEVDTNTNSVSLSSEDTSSKLKFCRYFITENGKTSEYFTYEGDESLETLINFDSVIPTELDNVDISTCTHGDEGVYYLDVTLSGNTKFIGMPLVKNCDGKSDVEKATYSFCLNNNKLEDIYITGSYDTHEVGTVDTKHRSRNIIVDIAFTKISYDETEFPDLSEVRSDNKLIDDMLISKSEFVVSEEIGNPANCDDEFMLKAEEMWQKLYELPEDNRNSVKNVEKSLSSIARDNGYYSVESSYALQKNEHGIVRFTVYNSDYKAEGHILVPFVCSEDNIDYGTAFSISINDKVEITPDGRIHFHHKIDGDHNTEYLYMLGDDAQLELICDAYYEKHVANLASRPQLLDKFPEEDRAELKKIAKNYKYSHMCEVKRYHLYREDETYYVLYINREGDTIEEIKKLCSVENIELVTEEKFDNVANYYYRKVPLVLWVKNSGE